MSLPGFPETPTPARFPMYVYLPAERPRGMYFLRCDVREKTADGTAKVVETRPLPNEPPLTKKKMEERSYNLNLQVWQIIKGS